MTTGVLDVVELGRDKRVDIALTPGTSDIRMTTLLSWGVRWNQLNVYVATNPIAFGLQQKIKKETLDLILVQTKLLTKVGT